MWHLQGIAEYIYISAHDHQIFKQHPAILPFTITSPCCFAIAMMACFEPIKSHVKSIEDCSPHSSLIKHVFCETLEHTGVVSARELTMTWPEADLAPARRIDTHRNVVYTCRACAPFAGTPRRMISWSSETGRDEMVDGILVQLGVAQPVYRLWLSHKHPIATLIMIRAMGMSDLPN